MPITSSVGKAGVNVACEVQYVQALLNIHREEQGLEALSLDGKVGLLTVGAIETYQTAVTGFVDGLIQPEKATITALEAQIALIVTELRTTCSLALLMSWEPVQEEPPPEQEPVLGDYEFLTLVGSIMEG